MSRCIPVPVSEALDSVIASMGCFIYDYQGLIAGILAIIAALYAGIPVWKQLKHSDLQTIIVHRQTLSALLDEVQSRVDKVDSEINEWIERVLSLSLDNDGSQVKISTHDAHSIEYNLMTALDKCKQTLLKSELPSIDRAKLTFYGAVENLINELGRIHMPASQGQSGEDWSYTDREWKEYLDLSEKAQDNLPETAFAADEALAALQKEQNAWVRDLRARIAKLDIAIATWDGTA